MCLRALADYHATSVVFPESAIIVEARRGCAPVESPSRIDPKFARLPLHSVEGAFDISNAGSYVHYSTAILLISYTEFLSL